MLRLAPIRSRRQRGSSLLETALMIVVIFTVLFWIFEVCWLVYTYTVLANAANEGVRYAIVHSGGDSTGTQTRVSDFAQASMHNMTALSTVVSFPDGDAKPPHRVRVTVTYTYVPALSQFITSPTMSAYAEGAMVIQ